MKFSFYNDYAEGAHPAILEALKNTNLLQESGYSEDQFSEQAAGLIKQKIGQPNAAVNFVSGGTQANLIVLASLLKPYESVIAAASGHIAVHEAGAIEATGHKINTVISTDGKVKPEQVTDVVTQHTDEHMVKPKVLFISQSTEVGTVYTKQELENLAAKCKEHNLYLYVDGARLGSALMANGADVSLSELAKLADAFYIGGTKNGALLGEAIVLVNPDIQQNFRYHLKQRGALLAKGRVISLQFTELFTNDLYFQLAKHANDMAAKLTGGITQLGYPFLSASTSNQIFPIFPDKIISQLEKLYGFYVWSKQSDDTSAIRLVTSWATRAEAVEMFLTDLKNLASQYN